jgi:Cu-Zn family superoxide dismutase
MKLVLAIAPLLAWSLANADVQRVALKNAKGDTVGTATLTALEKGVKLVADIHGLTPGEHAIHFHEKASCVGPKFESAGGHYNPTKASHGFDNSAGPHAGDMPNFFADKVGSAHLEIVNTDVTLGPGPDSLTGSGGTSLVIHEKADDFKSQPAGDAGARFACGEIK